MTARVLLSAVVGTAVLIVWGMIFWMVLPFGNQVIRTAEAEDEIIAMLDSHLTETGVYFMPLVDSYDPSTIGDFMEKHKRGPLAQIAFRKEGVDAMSPMIFIKGALHYFVSVLFLCGILLVALPRLTTYRGRVFFVFLVGVFAAFFSHLTEPIWLHSPLRYALYNMDFHILGWLFVGLAVAAIIRPDVASGAQS
jgi:hypothetical protein